MRGGLAAFCLMFLAWGLGCGGGGGTGTLQASVKPPRLPVPPEIVVPEQAVSFRLEVFEAQGGERIRLPLEAPREGGAGGLTMTMPDVPEGRWVVRLSALDRAGAALAHSQQVVSVAAGATARVTAPLHPGPAPEGLLFVANAGAAELAVVRLSDLQVDRTPLSRSPLALCTLGGRVYVATGAAEVLVLEGVARSVRVLPSPMGGMACRAGTVPVFSFPGEGGVRVLQPDSLSFSALIPTGPGASWISREVGGRMWVANPPAGTLTPVSLADGATGSDLLVGAPISRVEPTLDGARLYALTEAARGVPAVRVYSPQGGLVQTFTSQLGAPADLLVEGDGVYVSDPRRNEILRLQDGPVPQEGGRLALGEGGPAALLSDGTRLFVCLESTGEVAIVDLATFSLQGRVRVGQRPQGMTLLR